MEEQAFLTVAMGLVVLGFVLYLIKYKMQKPDYSEVPEIFKDTLPDEEPDEEGEDEEHDGFSLEAGWQDELEDTEHPRMDEE